MTSQPGQNFGRIHFVDSSGNYLISINLLME